RRLGEIAADELHVGLQVVGLDAVGRELQSERRFLLGAIEVLRLEAENAAIDPGRRQLGIGREQLVAERDSELVIAAPPPPRRIEPEEWQSARQLAGAVEI